MRTQRPHSPTVPLMLLPGTLCDERLFACVCSAAGQREITVGNMYGAASIGELSQRLLQTAPARFALAGFSLGGIVALEIAAMAPDRIAGLALIGSNARDVPAELHEERRFAARTSSSTDQYIEQLFSSYLSGRNFQRSDLRDLILAMATASPPGALEQQTEVLLSRTDSRPRLHDYSMPALVLAGAEDLLAPEPLQLEMAGALVDAQLVLVANAGHFVLLEEPEASADAIYTWLMRVDSNCLKTISEPLEAA